MEGEGDDHVMGSGCFKSEAQEKVKANFGSSEGKAFHSKCREVQTFLFQHRKQKFIHLYFLGFFAY